MLNPMTSFSTTDSDSIKEFQALTGISKVESWLILNIPHSSYEGASLIDVDGMTGALERALKTEPLLRNMKTVYHLIYPAKQ